MLPDVDGLSRKVARYYARCAGFPTFMNGCGLGSTVMGRRGMNGAMSRDLGEVQGLRIK
ncbi:hypothetical protein [Metallosphaera hakonensis]|uniref:hypothetical protein n=1 Tax=Metallosphaera hakonensis TaxID=79601 RepID=UPI000AF11401|nr:hypothetical protein [Metallosphaera hakonensis]